MCIVREKNSTEMWKRPGMSSTIKKRCIVFVRSMSKMLIPVYKVWTRQGYTWPGSDNKMCSLWKRSLVAPPTPTGRPHQEHHSSQKSASLEEVLGLPHCPHKAVSRGSRVRIGKCCPLEDLEMIFGSEKRLGGLGWDLVEASCWSGLPLPSSNSPQDQQALTPAQPNALNPYSQVFSQIIPSVGWGP